MLELRWIVSSQYEPTKDKELSGINIKIQGFNVYSYGTDRVWARARSINQ